MSKMIQLRNVPDYIHRKLKMRAAEAGMTLSAYLVREVTSVAERPTVSDVLDRIKSRRPAKVDEDSAAAVRAERDARR